MPERELGDGVVLADGPHQVAGVPAARGARGGGQRQLAQGRVHVEKVRAPQVVRRKLAEVRLVKHDVVHVAEALEPRHGGRHAKHLHACGPQARGWGRAKGRGAGREAQEGGVQGFRAPAGRRAAAP